MKHITTFNTEVAAILNTLPEGHASKVINTGMAATQTSDYYSFLDNFALKHGLKFYLKLNDDGFIPCFEYLYQVARDMRNLRNIVP